MITTAAMKPGQLKLAMKRLDCDVAQLSDRLNVDPSTVRRWLSGDRKIPGPVKAAIECWLSKAKL